MTLDQYGIGDQFFAFIEQHRLDDTGKLLLSKQFLQVPFDLKFAALQIECRRRTTKKLSQLQAECPRFIFPTLLSTEQCTHQAVAQLHASILASHRRVIDLTAGLGIDDYYIASQAREVISVEINPLLATALRHNMELYRPNVTVVNDDACSFLKHCPTADAIFIDPARRDTAGKRTYGLTDCEPDVLKMINDIKRAANTLYIKASPMLDISQLLLEMPLTAELWVVSVANECKEVLLRIDFMRQPGEPVTVHALNIDPWQSLTFTLPRPEQCKVPLYATQLQEYLYEPNSSIMKAAAFPEVSVQFPDFQKLHQHTHLFTSSQLHSDFPGKIFIVQQVIPFKSNNIKQLHKQYPKASISTRNFRLSASQLHEKLKIADGGNTQIIATTLQTGDQVLIIATRT